MELIDCIVKFTWFLIMIEPAGNDYITVLFNPVYPTKAIFNQLFHSV